MDVSECHCRCNMVDPGQGRLGSINGMNTQSLIDELNAALELLASPPKEAFADIGGAPNAPGPTQANAAQQWQHKALQLLNCVQELIHALAERGALPALGSEAPKPEHTSASAEEFNQVSGTTFWRDITSVSSNNTGSHGSAASGGKGNPAYGQIDVLSGAQNGHGGKRSLIEEIDTHKPSHKQSVEPGIQARVIIEELGDDEEEHAGEPKSRMQLSTCPVRHQIASGTLCSSMASQGCDRVWRRVIQTGI